MSAVLLDPIPFPNKDYLKDLIKSVLREDKELMKSLFIELLEEDREFQEYVSGMILTYQDIPKRVDMLGEITGQTAKCYLNENEATIPEKITKLEEKITKLEEKIELKIIPDNRPETVTECRLDRLIEFAQTDKALPVVTEGDNTRVSVNGKSFKRFIESLPDDLKPKSNKNLRKLKKDLFELAEKRYTAIAKIDQREKGNKDLRLAVVRKKALPTVTSNTHLP